MINSLSGQADVESEERWKSYYSEINYTVHDLEYHGHDRSLYIIRELTTDNSSVIQVTSVKVRDTKDFGRSLS